MAKPKTKPTSKFLLHPNMPETYLVPFTLVPWSLLGFPKKKSSTQVLANFSPRRLVRDSLAFRCTFCRDRPAATAQTAAPLSKLTLDLSGDGNRKAVVKTNGIWKATCFVYKKLSTLEGGLIWRHNLIYIRKLWDQFNHLKCTDVNSCSSSWMVEHLSPSNFKPSWEGAACVACVIFSGWELHVFFPKRHWTICLSG